MRKFKMGLITLAASAAVLAPVGIASGSTQGDPKNHNDGQCGDALIVVLSCFTINDNEVTLAEAELQCIGVDVNALAIGESRTCSNGGAQIVRLGKW
jgi:hypothetical protein